MPASDRALSETVSIVLILCLVVILTIVIAALFLGNIGIQKKTAYIAGNISRETIAGKNILTFYHRAGDAAGLNTTGQAYYHISVYVDTASGSNKTRPVTPELVLKPGMTLYVFNTTGGYRVTANPADIAAATALSVDACPRRLRVIDDTDPRATLLLMQMDFPCVATGPAPTVTSMNVSNGNRGWPMVRSITGTNFLPGATAKFTRPATPDITASVCTYSSSTQLICTFDLLGKAWSPANYNVNVTNPDGKQGTRANYFTLNSPAPTITSSTPATGMQGTMVTITRLLGSNFQPGALVTYNNGSTNMSLTGITVVSATNITGTLTIPVSAPPGRYNVTVTNTDGKSITRASAFTVISNAPTVTAITNATGYRGWPVVERITGTNFQSGATARFNRSGAPDILATSCTFVSSTQLSCLFNINTGLESPPAYNIVVRNPDNQEAMRTGVFTLSSPAPTITTSTPNNGLQGSTIAITNLAGTNFQPGAIVVYRQGTYDIPLTSVNVVSRTQITGTLVIPTYAPTGSYWVNITNPADGKSGGTSGRFTVNTNAPTLTARSPTSAPRGWPVGVTLTGTRFQSGATANMTRSGSTPITATCSYVSSTQLSCTFNLAGATAATNWAIRVTNPDGKSSGTVAFSVTGTPTVTTISPASLRRGTSGNAVTVTGTNFQPGMTEVRFTTNTGTANAIYLSGINVVSSTQVQGTLSVPAAQVTGTYYVRVTNADGSTGISSSRPLTITI